MLAGLGLDAVPRVTNAIDVKAISSNDVEARGGDSDPSSGSPSYPNPNATSLFVSSAGWISSMVRLNKGGQLLGM